MKHSLQRHYCRFVFVTCCWAALGSLHAQTPTLNITPPSITNDYVGKIVLTISNITSGQKVIVQKYLDVNGNGIIDGQDSLVQSFGVTDGKVPLIGGVRNISVPGDEDGATNGQVRVESNYPRLNQTLDHIAGHYLFQVVDPNGVFSPVVAPFSIMQKAYPQGVSGQAVAAGTGLPLTNAVVVLVQPNGDNGAGTVADANGNFSISNAPGNFAVVAFRPGCVADQSSAGVGIASNSFAILNLTNPGALPLLSGNVSDAGSGAGLAGLFLQANSTNNLMTIGFTDTNGNFNLPVTSNQWQIKIKSDSGVTEKGYVITQNSLSANTYNGSVSNLNFQFPKATALIYGTITDTFSNTIPAFQAEAQDFSFTYDAQARSTSTGSYGVGVFAASWSIGPNSGELNANGWLATNANVSLTNGQALLQNLVIQRSTAHLRGRVVDITGAPLANIGLYLNLVVGSGPSADSVSSQTLSDGTFDMGAFGGSWNLAMECQDPVSRGLVPSGYPINVVDGVDQTNLTLIARPVTGYITGNVRDVYGNPVTATVYASAYVNGTNYNPCGGQNSSSFSMGVFNGAWSVGISGDLTSRGYDNPPNQTVNVTGTNTVVNIILYPLGQTPPRLSALNYANGTFQLILNGDTEHAYRIDVTTNLFNPNSWVPLRTNVAYGGTFSFTDTNATRVPPRYYRAVLMQ